MTGQLVIGIDLGTTGLKAVMVDDCGRVQATAFKPYPLIQPRAAWAEQDPNEWALASIGALRDLLANSKAPPSSIAGIGIAGQIDGAVPVDENGSPLGNAIIWMDRRAKSECDKIRKLIDEKSFYESTGLSIDPSHMAPKIMWIKENRPKDYRKARRMMLPGNYLLHFLTGESYTDHSNASCSMLYDLKRREWSSRLCDLFGIPAELLPEIRDSTYLAGNLTRHVAKSTGLAESVQVSVGGGDEEVGGVGAGTIDPLALLDLTGTSEPMCLTLNEPFLDPTRLLECHVHGHNGMWMLENTGGLSGGIIRWFKDEFATVENERAQRLGVDTYQVLDDEIASVAPGCDGLLFLPFMSGAILPEWNPDARGTFLGLTLGHKRQHLARSIMEGTAYVLKDYVEHCKAIGLNPSRVIVAGGGARGTVWRQIKSDVIGYKTQSCRNEEVTVLGAAALAAVGLGLHKTVEEAVSRMVSLREETTPNTQATQLYSRLHMLYLDAYHKLKPAFTQLSSFQET